MDNKDFKKIEPSVAIGILLMLVLLVLGLGQHVSLQKEIKDSCGYETNKYYCICHDFDSPEAKLDMENKEILKTKQLNVENLSLWD